MRFQLIEDTIVLILYDVLERYVQYHLVIHQYCRCCQIHSQKYGHVPPKLGIMSC
jgi:hypothetical protein